MSDSRWTIERHLLVFAVILVLAAVTYVHAGAAWTAALVTVGFSLFSAASPTGNWQPPSNAAQQTQPGAAGVFAAGLLWCAVAWGSSYCMGAFEHPKVARFVLVLPLALFGIYLFIRCVRGDVCAPSYVLPVVVSIHALPSCLSVCYVVCVVR